MANLCTTQIATTANGNATPLFCTDGSINVQAWNFYSGVSASILGLGLKPTAGQVQSALCDDLVHNHATRLEEVSGYQMASAYYGWKFNMDPTTVACS